ncbi:MAG: hypothetical protein MUP21_06025 [Dehalococcoidia bacterium]|nr:hypothetical protein [Dehalococcoidia bacterium]
MTGTVWTEAAIRNFQAERMKSYPSAQKRTNTSPLSKEGAGEFLTVASMHSPISWEEWVATNGIGPLEKEFPELAILTKRLTVFDFGEIKITIDALLCGLILAGSVGGAIVFLCDMLLFWYTAKPKLIGSLEVAARYPHGFYSETALCIIVDKFMKTGVHPFAFVYGVNADSAEDVYGEGVHSQEWQWPYPHNENPN